MSYESAGGFKIREQDAIHFMTFTVVGWIDVFSRKIYRDIVLESMQFCRQNKGLVISAYVIMTNHIHVIWQAPGNNLSDITRDFKTFTSKAIAKAINNEPESRRNWLDYMFRFYANGSNKNDTYKVWTNDNHPEVIYTTDFFFNKLNYIHNNPVKAGFVQDPIHYLYSSASNYFDGSGIFNVDLLY